MAKNEVYRVGQYVPAPVPAAVSPATEDTNVGRALHIGVLNAVQVSKRNSVDHEFGGYAGEASVDLGGAHILPVTISGGPLTWGQPIYITGAGALVTTATGNTLFGAALEYNVANGSNTPVVVKILN